MRRSWKRWACMLVVVVVEVVAAAWIAGLMAIVAAVSRSMRTCRSLDYEDTSLDTRWLALALYSAVKRRIEVFDLKEPLEGLYDCMIPERLRRVRGRARRFHREQSTLFSVRRSDYRSEGSPLFYSLYVLMLLDSMPSMF